MLGVSHVVTTSVGMCDIDIRPVSASLPFCIKVFLKVKKSLFGTHVLLGPMYQYFTWLLLAPTQYPNTSLTSLLLRCGLYCFYAGPLEKPSLSLECITFSLLSSPFPSSVLSNEACFYFKKEKEIIT